MMSEKNPDSDELSQVLKLLEGHKQDSNTFFRFIKDHKPDLEHAFTYIGQNPEGMASLIDSAKTPTDKNKLLNAISDPRGKALMSFFLAHPDDASEMFGFFASDGTRAQRANQAIDFIAENEIKLTEFANIAAKHSDAIKKGGPSALAAIGPVKAIEMKMFASKHKAELGKILSDSEAEGKFFISEANFLLSNPEGMGPFATGGMTSIEKTFSKEIGQGQNEANLKIKEQTQIEAKVDALRKLSTSDHAKFLQVLEAEKQALALSQGNTIDKEKEQNWEKKLPSDLKNLLIMPENMVGKANHTWDEVNNIVLQNLPAHPASLQGVKGAGGRN